LQFCKKKTEKLWFINGRFTIISGHFFAIYMKIFHKTEVQMVNLRCLVCLNHNWIKSNDIVLAKNFFYAWKCIISGLVCWSEFWHLLGNQLSYFLNGYLSKFLCGFIAGVFYNVKNWSSFITSKNSSENLSNHNKHLCFCCLQDKTWIKMTKWTIFLIPSKVFVLITEIF
jgi:hypothetical protein